MKRLVAAMSALIALAGCDTGAPRDTPIVNNKSKVAIPKMLSDETREEIAALVRTGFYDKSRLQEIVCEEMYEPGELDEGQVAATIDDELAKLSADKKSWPAITDCDRLESAFTALAKRGIIALHNAGYTQSDGYDDFQDAYSRHPQKTSIVGYCFYHGQDVERAVHGGGLYFAFGPVDPKHESTEGPAVGRIVREELERTGLHVNWDGTFGNRMFAPKFVWQRR